MDPVKDYNKEPAAPGTPLEPDQLDEALPASSMEKRSYYEDKEPLPEPERARKAAEPAEHPTASLDVGKRGGKPGKPATKPHPTAELHIKPGGRR